MKDGYRLPGHYLYVTCRCGHKAVIYERNDEEPWIYHLPGPRLDKLRCTVCGRVGRPHEVRIGWAALP